MKNFIQKFPIFNHIKTLIHFQEKKVLGRWNTEYCKHKIDKKIDLSNEDHCGPCGQYILQQKHIQTKYS